MLIWVTAATFYNSAGVEFYFITRQWLTPTLKVWLNYSSAKGLLHLTSTFTECHKTNSDIRVCIRMMWKSGCALLADRNTDWTVFGHTVLLFSCVPLHCETTNSMALSHCLQSVTAVLAIYLLALKPWHHTLCQHWSVWLNGRLMWAYTTAHCTPTAQPDTHSRMQRKHNV